MPKHLADRLPLYGLVGEMATADISLETLPLSDEARASLEKLMEGDDDPCLVAVEIEEGKGGHGLYTAEAIKDIVDGVNRDQPMGFLGHQEPEKLPFEFPQPATHWFAAEMLKRGGKAVARVYGLVEPTMKQLKKWLRSGRINTVSIFGRAKFRPGSREIVGYELMSIDWTPRKRAGMTTRLVWASEMTGGVGGELDGSFEELRDAIQAAVTRDLGSNAWVHRLYTDGTVIVEHHDEQGGRRWYRYDYTVDGDDVALSNRVEVVERRTFEPAGEQQSGRVGFGDSQVDRNSDGGGHEVTLQEMLAAIRSALAKGETTVKEILGEIGITKEQAIEAVAKDDFEKLTKGAKLALALKESLGLSDDLTVEQAKALTAEMTAVWSALGFDKAKPEDPAKVVGEMVQAQAEAARKAREATIDKLIAEKVTGEQAQALVKRMLNVAEDATEEQIVGEIDALLADEAVKGVLGKLYVDKPAGTVASGSGSASGEQRRYTVFKQVPI